MLILPQTYRKLWEQIRQHNIKLSASTIPDVFGLGYKTRRSVWLEKCHKKSAIDNEHLIRMKKYGQEKEAIAKQEILDMPLFKEWKKFNIGFWRYAKNPAYGFSPDLVLVKNDKSELSGIEIKCPFYAQDDEDLPRIGHLIQSICCMEMSTVCDSWYLFYWQPEPLKKHVYKIERNQTFWEEQFFPLIEEAANLVWNPSSTRKQLSVNRDRKIFINDLILKNYKINKVY